jgi:hypothetical protein
MQLILPAYFAEILTNGLNLPKHGKQAVEVLGIELRMRLNIPGMHQNFTKIHPSLLSHLWWFQILRIGLK